MKTHKISLIILGLLGFITIILAIIIQVNCNNSHELDFVINILIGIFGSSLITTIYSLISYLFEYNRLIDEMSRYFTLVVLSLDQSSRDRKEEIVYKLENYDDWKTYNIEFFRMKKRFSPFFSNFGKARNIEKASKLLSQLSDEVTMKDYHIKSTNISDNESMNNIFREIREIKITYKAQINTCLESLMPGVSLNQIF